MNSVNVPLNKTYVKETFIFLHFTVFNIVKTGDKFFEIFFFWKSSLEKNPEVWPSTLLKDPEF